MRVQRNKFLNHSAPLLHNMKWVAGYILHLLQQHVLYFILPGSMNESKHVSPLAYSPLAWEMDYAWRIPITLSISSHLLSYHELVLPTRSVSHSILTPCTIHGDLRAFDKMHATSWLKYRLPVNFVGRGGSRRKLLGLNTMRSIDLFIGICWKVHCTFC